MEDALRYGKEAITCLVKQEDRGTVQDWLSRTGFQSWNGCLRVPATLMEKSPKSGKAWSGSFLLRRIGTIQCPDGMNDSKILTARA
jgi:hypothetical protein